MSDTERVREHLWWSSVPVPIATIAKCLGLSRRQVEAAVQELRLAGEPIIADGDGLRMAWTAAELARYRANFEDRLRTMVRTRRALRDTERRMRRSEAGATQTSLWGAA